MVREEYVRLYEKVSSHFQMHAEVIRIHSNGYLPISLVPPSKLQEILGEVKKAIQITNPDYDVVIITFIL